MAATSEKKRRGKYLDWLEPERLELITGWSRRGLSMEQIAHNMGISKPTLINWKYNYPEIKKALSIGREVADMMVENALFKRACGFEISETKETSGPRGAETITMIKMVPGDVNAQMFWLKNRQPDVWKDRKEEELSVETKEQAVVMMPLVNFVEPPEDAEVVDE